MYEKKSTALYISFVSIALNLFLTLLKLVVGILGHSYALVSDGIHSSADVVSSAVIAVGIRMKHENAAAVITAAILFVTGATLGYESVAAIVTESYGAFEQPTALAMIMSAVPVVLKELMYRYENGMAKRFKSEALHADALHHRADAFVSTGVLLGVAGGFIGYPIADKLAGLAVSVLILKIAVELTIGVVKRKRA